jgi:restriction endonuclease S subunit
MGVEFKNKKLKYAINTFEKPETQFLASDANDGEYTFVTSGETLKKIDKFQFNEEALIVSKTSNFIINHIDEKFSTTNDCVVFKAKENINSKFLYYNLYGKKLNIDSLYTGQGLKHISTHDLYNVNIELPSLELQNKIVKYLDEEVSKVDENIKILEEKLNLLKQYKSSLIYEVSTGKKEV